MTRSLLAILVSAALGASAALAQPGEHTLNLKDADIRVLIATVSEITGKNFIVDPKVEGKVNIVSTRPMSADEVYQVFESVLRVHGYAAVNSGSMVKIVPEIIANQDGSAASVGSRGPDSLSTEVIPLKHVSAAELIPILRPLIPQQAQIAAHKSSNALIIVDRAGNIARIEALIQRIDQASDASIEVVPLSHANASEMARTLTLLGGDNQADQINGTAPARVFADARTNSLLLSGDPSARLRMRALIGHLDEPLQSGDATQVVYLRYAKAEDLVPILETTAKTLNREAAAKEGDKGGGSSGATIKAHNETNALIISADPAVFHELQSVIRQLDVRRAQVLIEGVIAEVSTDRANELGIQMQNTSVHEIRDAAGNVIGISRGLFGGTNFNGPNGTGNILGAAVNPLTAGSGLNLGFIGGSITLPGSDTPILQLGGLVRALDGDGRSNILSTPTIVTLDHQEAMIKVGQEVPFIQGEFTTNVQGTGTGSSGVSGNPFRTVQRKDVGLKLTVTPHINEGDSVRLDIKQEVSSIANAVPGASDLITNNREITTSVLVGDRQTLVLGGLVSTETKENVSKVPALGDIPILGNLFRYRSATTLKRNLMVFLQPTILRDAATEASVSSEKYNFMRAEQLKTTQNQQNLLPSDAQPVLPPRDIPAPAPAQAPGEPRR